MNFDNKLDEELFANRLYEFAKNDEENSLTILNIVAKLKWIKNKEINDYFIKYMRKNYSQTSLLVDFAGKAKSSSTGLISLISGENLCYDNQIIKIEDITPKEIETFDKIYFIDDYIGSGETIINAIGQVWDSIKNKDVYVIAYASQKNGMQNINIKYPNVNIISNTILNKYNEEYNKNEVNYIERICNCCPNKRYSFGYNSVGAYIVINKVAPNSDISMLWYPSIKYKQKRWMNLLDRQVSIEILSKKNNELIKNNSMLIREIYNQLSNKYEISLEEFEFLIYSYGCYYTKNQLINDGYFDNEEEFDKFAEGIIKKEYITVKNGYIIISNNLLYEDIKKSIEYIYKQNNKDKKNVTNNF